MAVPTEVKRLQDDPQPILTNPEPESGIENSESLLETPKPVKPQRRILGNRFPVKPWPNGMDTSAENAAKSANPSNPPPIPLKSHFRMSSSHNESRLRRPNLAPLVNGAGGSNRSNSETILQASAAARSKRMGMLRKEKLDLEPVEEIRNRRVSHLRGVSHGSVLRSRSSNALSPGNAASSPASPRDGRRSRDICLKRMSSLPEQKQERPWSSPVMDGARGILYALYQIHPHISGLIGVIKCRDLKLTSLELTYYNASSHVDRLNDALEQASTLDARDEEAIQRSKNSVQRDCASCIMAYLHVIIQLQESVKKIVAGADARYVRTLMLLLYGSMIEIKNSISSFHVEVRVLASPIRNSAERRFKPASKQLSSHRVANRSFHPAAKRPERTYRPGTHHSGHPSFEHPTLKSIADLPPNQRHRQTHHTQLQRNLQYPHGASVAANAHRTNGISLHHTNLGHSPADYSVDSRSRSNTGSINNLTLTSSSLTSSATHTPRSGESFNLPGLQAPMHVNSWSGASDPPEEALFESIYLALSRAYDAALQALPIARRQFVRHAEMAEEDHQPRGIRELWRNLASRCKSCLDVGESLHTRLITMKVRDKPNRGRDDRSFWQLTKSFTQSFIDLVGDMKEAKSLHLLSQNLVVILRPVQKASREAVRLIDSSPWAYLTEAASSQPPPLAPLVTNPFLNGYDTRASQHHVQMGHSYDTHHHHTNRSYHHLHETSVGSAAAQSVSPGSAALPATPLSAALGAAAQATVPSGPPSSLYGSDSSYYRSDPPTNMHQSNGNLFNGRR